ncbi:HAD family phosphatase [Mucilaginibacter sp. JRF]|uniref:HAD family hydrolase n=1 Tax=Mucilaginibacter sp. JRF TaxID=2780088 RepID=UPI00187DF1E8|nr:HAD family phosphatase [Mucilaginibacter sp. JRF]MBE9583880.1 HAD family phosphatase [Mucilaginibacter sp. JRF]
MAVIFDMDGVIIDSNPVIIKAWKNFFDSQNITLTDEQFNHYIFGRTASDTLRMVYGKPLEADVLAEYCTFLNSEVGLFYETESKLVPGITEFVKALAAHNIPVAIATSAPRKNVDLVLKLAGISDLFKVITDASQVQFSKPHPEVYLKTAERLMIDPSRCVVFEDSFSGIAAAKAAGMMVIGLSTTHTANELSPETEEVISDFSDIDAQHIINLFNDQYDAIGK